MTSPTARMTRRMLRHRKRRGRSGGGKGILRRGDGEAGPEMLVERGLVVEAGCARESRDRPAPLHQAARRVEPDLGEQRIRGKPAFALEEADQLERAHVERPGDV